MDAFLFLQNASWGIIGSGISLSLSASFSPHKLQIKVPQTVLPPPGETVDQGGDLVGGPRRLRHLLFNQAEGRALVRYFNGEPLVQYVPGNIISNNMCGRCEFDERLLAKAGNLSRVMEFVPSDGICSK